MKTYKAALLVVDVQNDFLPGGRLGVGRGDTIVPRINQLIAAAPYKVATQDWHPADHGSFSSQHPGRAIGDVVVLDGVEQVLWPDHCVQGTVGADLAAGLAVDSFDAIVFKGATKTVDSYSAFSDAKKNATELEHNLREAGIDTLYVAGLATDYCVKFTVLDALSLGFKVTLVVDACRGVDLNRGDSEDAIHNMAQAGARLMDWQSAVKELTAARQLL